MSIRALILAAAAFSAAPALAQTVLHTHEEVRMPAGKTVKLYRPIARDDCRAAQRHHQAGKTMLHPTRPGDERCATQANAAQAKTVVAAAD